MSLILLVDAGGAADEDSSSPPPLCWYLLGEGKQVEASEVRVLSELRSEGCFLSHLWNL